MAEQDGRGSTETPMPEEPDETGPRPPQDAAGELARMGIDPTAVGLDEPTTIMLPPTPGQPGAAPHAPPAPPADPPLVSAPPAGAAPLPDPAAPSEPAARRSAAQPIRARPLLDATESVAPADQVPAQPRDHPAVWPTTALSRPLTPPQPAGFAEPTGVELAQRLYPEELGLVVPAGWRRLVRAATLGLFAPGAAAAMERERLLVSQVRDRQTDTRTIAFVAGKGGVGTTTTGIGVGLTLATLRTDETVLVDGRIGARSLGERVAEMRAPTTLELADETDRRTPLSYRSRLHLVDSPPWHAPADPEKLGRLLGRLRESFQFIAVDVGNESGPAGQAALARADQVVIVTSTTRDAGGAARVVLGRIQRTDPSRLATLAVAVVCVAGRGWQRTVRELREELGLEESRIVPVPHDPGLVAGDRFDPDRLRTVTREAYLRLAVLLARRVDVPVRPAVGVGVGVQPTLDRKAPAVGQAAAPPPGAVGLGRMS